MADRRVRANSTTMNLSQSTPTLSAEQEIDDLERGSAFLDTDVGQLRKKVKSLENEVQDLRRLLRDAMSEKKEIQLQKDELQLLVDELNGKSSISGAHDTPPEQVITDRAKRTMMHLRLERTEEKRKQLQDIVRSRSYAAVSALKQVRAGIKTLKDEISDQMERARDLLVSGARSFRTLSERSVSSNSLTRIASGIPENRGDYLSLVTAAVQEQQKNIVLSPEHPVVVKLAKFLDSFDALIHEQNSHWGSMECFASGKPPQLTKPRRYIDPSVNLANYTVTATTMKDYVSHSRIMSILYSDMTLPELERRTHQEILTVFTFFTTKLANLFEAMRVIRTPVVIRKHSLANALRVAASIDVTKDEVTEVQKRYDALCHEHTARCFRYIARMLAIGRKFSEARSSAVGAGDEWNSDELDISSASAAAAKRPASIQHPPNLSSIELMRRRSTLAPAEASLVAAAEAEEEEALRAGGDFHNIVRHQGTRRRLYIQRRDMMSDFTGQRVRHIHALTGLVEDVARIMRRHRLISVESCETVTGKGGAVVGSAVGGAGGGGGGAARSPQNRGLEPLHDGEGGSRSRSPATKRSQQQSAAAGLNATPGQSTGVHGASDRFRFTAHEQLLKSKVVTTSDFYFEKKRREENKQQQASSSGIMTARVASGAFGGTADGSQRGFDASADRRGTLQMVRDMEILGRLSPRKPTTPFAFERQQPVRMLPAKGATLSSGSDRAVTAGAVPRPPLGNLATPRQQPRSLSKKNDGDNEVVCFGGAKASQ